MSAVEALADALYEDVPTLAGWQIDQVIECVAAAIRSMPAEQVAELIGGSASIEYREAEDGSAGSWTRTDGTRGGSSTLPTRSRRYVTPWVVDRPRKTFEWSTDARPLGVSPETNGEQDERRTEMSETLPCIACGTELESVLSDPGAGNDNQPSGGACFLSYGQYGSAAFDPMDGSALEVNICDDCLRANRDRILRYPPRQTRPDNRATLWSAVSS